MIGSLSPNPNLFVKHTQTVKGRGVFTHKPYNAGEVVEVSPVSEIEARWDELTKSVQMVVYDWGWLTHSGRNDLHCFALGIGSLLNHANAPNLEFAADVERQAIVFTATRDIIIGEELTIDYNSDIAQGQPSWFEAVGITEVD